MAITKEEIKVTLSEQLQQVGEISVSGRSATFKVKGLTPGQGTITVKYTEGGEEKTAQVTVNNTPTAGDFTPATANVEIGDKIKLTQAFDVAPSVEDVTFELPEGLTEVPESKKLEGTNVTVEVTMVTAGEKVVKSKYKGKETGKQVTLTGTSPSITGVAADPTTIDEGGESTVTVTFNELA